MNPHIAAVCPNRIFKIELQLQATCVDLYESERVNTSVNHFKQHHNTIAGKKALPSKQHQNPMM